MQTMPIDSIVTLKEMISRKRLEFERVKQELKDLKSMCNHGSITNEYGVAICDICGNKLGWYCEKSPIKNCSYDSGFEQCVYCGIYQERK